MPFEVFRRHQRKLLAVFAIMAMVSFVVSDSLPKLLNQNTSIRDEPVATLYGKTIYHSTLNEIREQRVNASMFFATLSSFMGSSPELMAYIQTYFGGMKTRDIIDALILEHEADRLGIPGGAEEGKKWLKKVTNDRMTRELFEAILLRFNNRNRVSGEQILADLGNQVRLMNVRGLMGSPMVSPYDVFSAYRDQNERVSGKLVEVSVDKFLGKVPEPSIGELEAYFNKFKDALPDPVRETPGFKIPRQIQVEIVSIDSNVVTREIKDQLTEGEIRSAYENRKSEFEIRGEELPADLFADQPELTPAPLRPFDEVRSVLAMTLAEEKAQVEVADRFAKIQDRALLPFAVKYGEVLDDNDDARKQGSKVMKPLPDPGPSMESVKELAAKEGLTYKLSPLLSREEAEHYDVISNAEIGLSMLSGGRKFAVAFFDPKTSLFEPEELSDSRGMGMKYLVRKVQDVAPRVPKLDEVRSQVALAWKTEQARPMAEKAANELAAQIKAKGGTIKESNVQGYRVVSVPPVTRLQSTFRFNRFEPGPPEETPIADVPFAGADFRNAYFELQTGSVAVAPNQPKSVYYVLTLDHRDPATFASLYAPNGDEFRYRNLARDHAGRQLDKEWMGWLRQQAGLAADWTPPDEVKGEASDSQDS